MGFSQVFRRSIPCLCSVPRPRSNRRALAITVTSMLPPLCAQRRLRATLDFGANPQLRHLLSYASRFALPLTRKARFRLAGSAFAVRESNPLDRYERFQLVLTIILPSCSPDASAIKQLRPTRSNHTFTSGTFGTEPRGDEGPSPRGPGGLLRRCVPGRRFGRVRIGIFSGLGVTGPSGNSKPSLASPASSFVSMTRTWPPD